MKKPNLEKPNQNKPEKDETRESEVAGLGIYPLPDKLTIKRDTVDTFQKSDREFIERWADPAERNAKILRGPDGSVLKWEIKDRDGKIIAYFDRELSERLEKIKRKAILKDRIRFREASLYADWLEVFLEYANNYQFEIEYNLHDDGATDRPPTLESIEVRNREDGRLVVEFRDPLIIGNINNMRRFNIEPLDEIEASFYFQNEEDIKDWNRGY